jgi:hypothetical protein
MGRRENISMSANFLNRLIDIAEGTEDLKTFLGKVEEIAPLEEAEKAVSLEFKSLALFHRWVHQKKAAAEGKRPQKREPSGKTESPQPQGKESLPPHPQVSDLKIESGILRAALEPLLFELDELVNTIVPNLTDLYTIKIGINEVELMALELENKRTLRTIEYIRKALAKGEEPELEVIGEKVSLEIAAMKAKLDADKKKIERAKMRKHFHMSADDSIEFKRLYRALIKKLNPEINPTLGERERELWARMKKAYAKGDIEELRLLEVLADDVPGETPLQPQRAGIASWESCQENLQARIEDVREKLLSVKSEFPYNIKDLLANDAWVEEKNRALRKQIEAEMKTKELCEMTLKELLKAIGKK